uniref:DC1 domain-containing protein n=1 Tax=Oryza punctata TaxID=4537 RepID=A0A0E0LUR0_ORYPU
MTKLFEDPPSSISHPDHPAHDLTLVTTGGAPFRCDGCMQPGDGAGYRCDLCHFDLHTCCALPPATLEHDMFEGSAFVFLAEPPAPAGGRICDACGDAVDGFVYHSDDPDLDLHPCCAFLRRRVVVQDGRLFELRKRSPRRCGMCGGERSGGRRRSNFWAYRTYDDDGEPVYLHVACVKDGHRGRPRGSGDEIVLASSSPAMDSVLQSVPRRRTRRSGGFERFRKIVNVVVSVIIAVIFGNPMAMISAVAGPDGLLRGLIHSTMRLFEEPPAKITHWAHPEHELTLASTAGAPFRCDGCQEPGGDGPRYRCAPCNFDLHTDCAIPPATLQHPLLFKAGCTFVFLREPPAPAVNRQCDACGDDVRGFVFHCHDRDLDLHPCCASLEDRIITGGDGDGDGRVFELTKAAASRRRCGVCGDKSSRFWFYRGRFDGEDVYIHVACVKELAVRRWEASYRRRSGAGQIVLAGAPLMEGALQSLSRKSRRSGGFERFSKIVGVIVSAIIAVIFGNPMGLIAAVAGPDGLLRG